MASSSCSSSLVLLLAVLVHAARGAFAATRHVVGDNQQWTFPQSASTYTDWANRQTFVVGDTLVFNFVTNVHDVLEVTKSNYDACNTQNPIAPYTAGPATVNLTSSGPHYFICGVDSHCSQSGQKMTVNVSAAPSTPTTPSPPPTSGGPTTPPPPSASPPPTSSTPAVPSSPGPSSAGTPPSAAQSRGLGKAAMAAVALTASVVALVL